MAFPNPARRAFLHDAGIPDDRIEALENWSEQYAAALRQIGLGQHEIQLLAGISAVDDTNSPIAAAFAAFLAQQLNAQGIASTVAMATPVAQLTQNAQPVVQQPVAPVQPAQPAAQPAPVAGQSDLTPEIVAAAITQAMAPIAAQVNDLVGQVGQIATAQQQTRDQIVSQEWAARGAAPGGGFRPADAVQTIPQPTIGPDGLPVLVQGQQSVQPGTPLDPRVLQQIAAGQSSAAGGNGTPSAVENILQRLKANHPILNGSPTESRG